ncbi:MAG TPA: carbamate kinase [Gaiellaceae bacterium]|nr:carbamate kinase [Gaiellaceae bacterium]
MRIVVALGGNALLRRGEEPSVDAQRANVEAAAAALAPLAAAHELVLTHGNGPQVGLLALQADSGRDVAPTPLDVLGAESEGMIGYLLVQALGNRLPGRRIASVLTQVAVDPGDPAFLAPAKPIGPVYREVRARQLAATRGWTIAADGDWFRRVVPSPEPLEIVEVETVLALLAAGVLPVCAGGGGIPVRRNGDGELRGVEAVIDKDLAAELLARSVGAERLLLLTDVSAVEWDGRPLRRATPAELRGLSFPAGSMGPKVEAACRFAERTGGVAAIGALGEAVAIVAGEAGTIVSV